MDWRKWSIACVAMAGVAYQVALIRLLSVVLWYHFAFLVVSLAVLGFGISGVWLVLRPVAGERHRERLGGLAVGLAASVVFGYLAVAWVPFDPFRMGAEPLQLVWGGLYTLAMMLPFLLNGMFVGLMLVRHGEDAGRLYAADLLGAGVAALLTLGLFGLVGGEGALLSAAVLAALGAWACRPGWRMGALVLGVVLVVGGMAKWVPARITEDKVFAGRTISAWLLDDQALLETRWNALSRVDVVEVGPKQREILLDGGVAVTRLPRVEREISTYKPILDFTCLGFGLVSSPRVVVLGSGGGWEVACALTHGASEVVGVELNGAINALVLGSQSSWVGDVFLDPRVDLVTDEARRFVSRDERRWDVVVSAHTISNAAAASGAMNLAESYTVTVEAFRLYVQRLTERGVVFMTRPEAQMPQLVANVSAALRAEGLEPETRVAVVRLRTARPLGTEFTAGVLVVRDPAVLRGLGAVVERHGGEVLWGDGVSRVPWISGAFAASGRLTTDDRPFFNFRGSWMDLSWEDFRRVFSAGRDGRLALEDARIGEVSLVVLLALLGVFSGVATLLPVWFRRAQWSGRGADVLRVFLYFGALGFGYMYAELGLVHRLGVVLGSPTVTFGVVVAGLLVSSGLGAAWSQRMELSRARLMLVAAAVVLLLAGFVAAEGVGWVLTLSTPGAVVACLALVVPVGVVLGMPFPTGMRAVHDRGADLLPVAWGVNGFAGVLGSATSILIATELGFSAVMVAAAAAYVVAAAVLPRAH